jgi:transposase InsO family protein
MVRSNEIAATVGTANAATNEDLMNRNFTEDEPNGFRRVEITEPATRQDTVYRTLVEDAFSRMAIGWPMSLGVIAEIVADAFQKTRWLRCDVIGPFIHADHRSQYTACTFILGSCNRAVCI